MKSLFSVLLLSLNLSLSAQATLKIGDPAPPIKVTKWLANVPQDTSLSGRFILLDFWANWSKSCLEVMPHLYELLEKNTNEDLLFLSLTDESPEGALPTIAETKFKNPVATDQTGRTQIYFGDGKKGLYRFPFTVLIDDKNIVRWYGDPEELTQEMMERFLNRIHPVEDWSQKFVPLDPVDFVFDQMDRKTFFNLWENDSIGSFIRLWEWEDIPLYTATGISMGVAEMAYYEDVSLDQIGRKFFPEQQLIFPDRLSGLSYTLAFIDRFPDKDALARLAAGIADQLGLTITRSTEGTTDYTFSIGKEKRLLREEGKGRTRVDPQDLHNLKVTKHTLTALAEVLTVYTNSGWTYRGQDRGKYNFVLDVTSVEALLAGLERYGLKVKGKKGALEVMRFGY